MSDNFRYRFGDSNPTRQPFKSGVAVSIGDLVFQDETDSYTVKPASSVTWQSAVADPTTAPTLADAASGFSATQLQNLAYKVAYTYVTPYGETGKSSSTTITPTAGHQINVAGIATPGTGVLSVNWYMTAAGGNAFFLIANNNGGSFAITGEPDGSAPSPPAANAISATVVTQYYFAQRCLGCAAQRFDGTNTTAYGIKDGKLRVDTGGVFDFACASTTFNGGEFVGMAKDTGNALLSQTVVLVASRSLAIGKVLTPTSYNPGSAPNTTVRVELFPLKMLQA